MSSDLELRILLGPQRHTELKNPVNKKICTHSHACIKLAFESNFMCFLNCSSLGKLNIMFVSGAPFRFGALCVGQVNWLAFGVFRLCRGPMAEDTNLQTGAHLLWKSVPRWELFCFV